MSRGWAWTARALICAVVLCLACGAPRADERDAAFVRYVHDPRAAMIAFNPSRFDPRRPESIAEITRADIGADLAVLRPTFDGLILYSTHPDLTPTIMDEAVARGFRAVMLGIWDPRSETEIAAAVAVITRYCQRLACALIVGNEGINNNRYTLADLARAAERVRQGLPPGLTIPVSTSEPSGDYGWPPLREFGDFLAPNIHPAIDQAARDPEAAAKWVHDRARAIAAVARKPVVVKETGLPNGGSPSFTPDRQLAFWRSYLAAGRLRLVPSPGADAWTFHGTAFEAFDAPWKAEVLRNPIEGHWGLFTIDRRPYPAVQAWRG